jgi:PAS domain S-box-containing protein
MAWAALALLIVARVATAILSSERHAAELTAWERRYETLVNTMGSAVYEWDPDSGRVIRSGAVEQIFGGGDAHVSETVDATLTLMHQDDRLKAETDFREAVKRGGPFEIEYRLRNRDGTWRLIRDRGFCEQDENGDPVRVLGIMADVTEERKNEERLRRAEKLASLGGLAAGAAHEINNPLAAISLAAQMLMEDDRLPEDVLDDVRVIERQASRAGEVTDRMLVFARRREGERDAYDINDLVREVLRSRRYEIETHAITLVDNPGEDLPQVWVDPVQIERVLTNVIINAEKAVAEMPDDERMLMVTTRATGNGVAVDIADSGPGIPEHVLPNIFDPFFTTREVGQGTGLGLSMSHSIVQAHGGDLKVKTAPGEGTTFILELPRAPAELDAAEKTIGGTRRAPDFVLREDSEVRSLSVLIVDDEKEIRELSRRYLVGKGHKVTEAATGREALKLVTANDYDGIVLDLRMPDMSGEGFFEWLRRNRPEMAARVTVISGDLANPQTVEILERIGQPYLLKPFKTHELLAHIEKNAELAGSSD